MPIARKQKSKPKKPAVTGFVLPTKHRAPVSDPWQYAYLITGEKKIGKTTLAIQTTSSTEKVLVIQFDKPQIAYNILETCPKSWKDFLAVLTALERAVVSNDFPYVRVVIDGVGEWYQMCMESVLPAGCKDPTDADDFGRTWRALATEFTKAVNRLLALQIDAQCGLVFIAHSEWKEKKTHGGKKTTVLVPNLTSRCEEILNGKVDAWFQYDYIDQERVLVTLGSETIAAGHRIDGHFLTLTGERIREIPMGSSASEALDAFINAFNNKQKHASWDEYLRERRATRTAAKMSKKKLTRRTR